MVDNRVRAFAEVVSVDAWHESFAPNRLYADLYAHVNFRIGRLGGEEQSSIRFRLGIRRAEVVLIRPDNEPVKIAKESVFRGTPQKKLRQITKIKKQQGLEVSLGIAGVVSDKGVKASAHANADVAAAFDRVVEILIDEDLPSILVTQSKSPNDNYQWEVSPAINDALDGIPWEPEQKLVTLKDGRKPNSNQIPPIVRIEVRCKREDLDISDLHIKDETLLEKISGTIDGERKIRAVEAYIRDTLAREGLEYSNISDPFGSLTLASAVPGEPDD